MIALAFGAIFNVAAYAATPLQPVKVIPGDTRAVDARYAAAVGTGGVEIWDLRTGELAASFEAPKAAGRESVSGQILDVSADGKWALFAVSRQLMGPEGFIATGKADLLVLSLSARKVVRSLAVVAPGDCDVKFGIKAACPSFSSAKFSPDGKSVIYWAQSGLAWSKTEKSRETPRGWTNLVHRRRSTLGLVDASGASSETRTFDGTWDDGSGQFRWVYAPADVDAGFLADGRGAVLFADAAGCRVEDVEGERISRLKGCTSARRPSFQAGLIWSKTGSFTVWNPATGAAKYRLPLVPNETTVAASDDLSAVVETLFTAPSETATVTVVDAKTGKAVLKREVAMPVSDAVLCGAGFLRAERRFTLCAVSRNADDGYKTYRALYDLN